MGQEFFIKSDTLESQVRKLLPSQGGLGAGFDLSASTQIVPIIDLTESAEGSNLRQDLQSALSFDQVTTFSVRNSSSDIITNTGYFRIFGNCSFNTADASKFGDFSISDGATSKSLLQFSTLNGVTNRAFLMIQFDFIVFINAGDKIVAESDSLEIKIAGVTRQLATIDGTLVNP